MGETLHIRVDNRLLHGQVVQFWLGHLGVDHLVVGDDDVASNEAMPTIYRMALPETVGLTVTTVVGLPAELERIGGKRALLLLKDVAALMRAIECGVELDRVTLGNVHAAPERERVTDSVYLSPGETADLATLEERGIEVEIQTFPGEVLRLVAAEGGGVRWSKS
jgi:PTS system mannose-specific IIB component